MTMDYRDFFKYLIENDDSDFPHGMGYPNYRSDSDDNKDFEKVARIDHIVDVPHQHSGQDNKKRTGILYRYIKDKLPEFYQKFQSYIDGLFAKYEDYDTMHHWLVNGMHLAKEKPTHQNVPDKLQGIKITDDDMRDVHKISDTYDRLYSLIHHRDDPENELNYPLYVSLYDITSEILGNDPSGFEGHSYYDKFTLIDSIEIQNPRQLVPTAEKLYAEISDFDGKPRIVVEKESGSLEKPPHERDY